MSTTPTPEVLSTYADGYGIWHARVTLPKGSHASDGRRAAHAAILAEVQQRQPIPAVVEILLKDMTIVDGVVTAVYAETAGLVER